MDCRCRCRRAAERLDAKPLRRLSACAMKALFLVALLCASARESLANGGGANVILSGSVTTVASDTLPTFSKTNEKVFLVMDQQTEVYNVYRLHHEGAAKTIQQIAAGTLR